MLNYILNKLPTPQPRLKKFNLQRPTEIKPLESFPTLVYTESSFAATTEWTTCAMFSTPQPNSRLNAFLVNPIESITRYKNKITKFMRQNSINFLATSDKSELVDQTFDIKVYGLPSSSKIQGTNI
ncbi:uncharacterized protein KGF55_003164 [Candida pseudojiufengensis]|uniref:uncharacterized protein n=1 Tax=Candida pseudojiufengensis TaxID=497109 RepID=UPI0022255F0C|nr:uncharacterized protein KGF55_003164 [Candida pseudojiufengensis]KAI5962088.1 hypothetical protein KGF55_003164 [Candida pseudojiufengensis]